MTFAVRIAAAAVLMTGAIIASANAAGPFDGTYAGATTNTQAGGGAGCGETGPSSRRVVDNVIVTKYGSQDLRIKVGPDGSINDSASVGSALLTIKGKITGNTMSYTFVSQRCAFRFDGTKG